MTPTDKSQLDKKRDELAEEYFLAWAERFEEWMDTQAGKMRGDRFFGPEIKIDCYCKTCKDGGQLLPGTTKMWIFTHKDHDTKTIKLR